MVRLLGHKVVVTSSGAASGGPSPTAADDPLALRQRLLSEAALRLQSGLAVTGRDDAAVRLAAHRSGRALRRAGRPVARTRSPWPTIEPAQRPSSMNGGDLAYTDEDEAAELDVLNFSAADQLTGARQTCSPAC